MSEVIGCRVKGQDGRASSWWFPGAIVSFGGLVIVVEDLKWSGVKCGGYCSSAFRDTLLWSGIEVNREADDDPREIEVIAHDKFARLQLVEISSLGCFSVPPLVIKRAGDVRLHTTRSTRAVLGNRILMQCFRSLDYEAIT